MQYPNLGYLSTWTIPLPEVRKTIFSQDQENLKKLLVEARKGAGLTQVQAAKKLGVPQSFISKVESGERRLDLIELRALCGVYKIRLVDFVKNFEASVD